MRTGTKPATLSRVTYVIVYCMCAFGGKGCGDYNMQPWSWKTCSLVFKTTSNHLCINKWCSAYWAIWYMVRVLVDWDSFKYATVLRFDTSFGKNLTGSSNIFCTNSKWGDIWLLKMKNTTVHTCVLVGVEKTYPNKFKIWGLFNTLYEHKKEGKWNNGYGIVSARKVLACGFASSDFKFTISPFESL